jgi:hypothetical protein
MYRAKDTANFAIITVLEVPISPYSSTIKTLDKTHIMVPIKDVIAN